MKFDTSNDPFKLGAWSPTNTFLQGFLTYKFCCMYSLECFQRSFIWGWFSSLVLQRLWLLYSMYFVSSLKSQWLLLKNRSFALLLDCTIKFTDASVAHVSFLEIFLYPTWFCVILSLSESLDWAVFYVLVKVSTSLCFLRYPVFGYIYLFLLYWVLSNFCWKFASI